MWNKIAATTSSGDGAQWELPEFFDDISRFLADLIEDLGQEDLIFLLSVCVAVPLLCALAGIVGYVLQSTALGRIAKGQGAVKVIARLVWVPYARYYAIGKLGERCEARRAKHARVRGKPMVAICTPLSVLAAICAVASFVLVVLPLLLLLLIRLLDSDGLPGILQIIAYVFVFAIFLFAFAVEDGALLLLGLCFMLGILLLVASLALSLAARIPQYVCFAKILREYFEPPVCYVLTVLSVLLDAFPITLLIASFRNPVPAAAYQE